VVGCEVAGGVRRYAVGECMAAKPLPTLPREGGNYTSLPPVPKRWRLDAQGAQIYVSLPAVMDLVIH